MTNLKWDNLLGCYFNYYYSRTVKIGIIISTVRSVYCIVWQLPHRTTVLHESTGYTVTVRQCTLLLLYERYKHPRHVKKKTVPCMRQLRGYNRRRNEGKMKDESRVASGTFSLVEWRRTDLVPWVNKCPVKPVPTTKQCGLYHGYDELRKDLFDAYNQKEISLESQIICNTPFWILSWWWSLL